MNDPRSDAERRRAELEAELARLDVENAEAATASPAADDEPEAAVPAVPAAPVQEPEAQLPATLSADDQQRVAVLQELAERGHAALDEEFPPAWVPWKDDTHPKELPACLVLTIDLNVGPSPTFGTYAAVITVIDGTSGQKWALWANRPDSALWHQLVRLKLQPGEVIGVRFKGQRPSKHDALRTVNDIKLVRVGDSDRPEFIDYDKLGSGDEPPPALPSGESDTAEEHDDIPF